jgi:hypothetical protein
MAVKTVCGLIAVGSNFVPYRSSRALANASLSSPTEARVTVP